MQKIPTIFERDWEGDRSRVLDQPTPGCEWVFEGFGVPTRKYDGICVMFDGHAWWARREAKEGKGAPPGFVFVTQDEQTGKTIGWEPIEQTPFIKYFREAVDRPGAIQNQGTYELIGPRVNGNPENVPEHWLISHANAMEVMCSVRTFDSIKGVLEANGFEGIVFQNADGRMGKIKGRDFGLKRR